MRSTQTPSNLYFDGYATQVILQNDLGTHGAFFQRKQQLLNLSDKQASFILKEASFGKFLQVCLKRKMT